MKHAKVNLSIFVLAISLSVLVGFSAKAEGASSTASSTPGLSASSTPVVETSTTPVLTAETSSPVITSSTPITATSVKPMDIRIVWGNLTPIARGKRTNLGGSIEIANGAISLKKTLMLESNNGDGLSFVSPKKIFWYSTVTTASDGLQIVVTPKDSNDTIKVTIGSTTVSYSAAQLKNLNAVINLATGHKLSIKEGAQFKPFVLDVRWGKVKELAALNTARNRNVISWTGKLTISNNSKIRLSQGKRNEGKDKITETVGANSTVIDFTTRTGPSFDGFKVNIPNNIASTSVVFEVTCNVPGFQPYKITLNTLDLLNINYVQGINNLGDGFAVKNLSILK